MNIIFILVLVDCSSSCEQIEIRQIYLVGPQGRAELRASWAKSGKPWLSFETWLHLAEMVPFLRWPRWCEQSPSKAGQKKIGMWVGGSGLFLENMDTCTRTKFDTFLIDRNLANLHQNKLCADTILRVKPRSPRQLTQLVSQRLLPEILEPPSYTTGHWANKREPRLKEMNLERPKSVEIPEQMPRCQSEARQPAGLQTCNLESWPHT